MNEHLPENLLADAAEEGITLTVRNIKGAVKVTDNDGEATFYYLGRKIEQWNTTEAWTRYRYGRYGFATLTEAKKYIDQKIANLAK